ncbi:MAG: prolipoprotein diacylglyceryl transferase family protein [Actinomycetota bacterium]
MHPDLGSIGPLEFHTFGLMVALGLVAAGWFLSQDVRQRGLHSGLALEMMLAAGVGGLAGSRVYYIVETGDTGGGLLSGSGLVWYGGLIGGAAAVIAVGALRRVPVGVIANMAAPGLAIGQCLGRIGCQLAGDGDYGTASTLPWAMSYPDGTVPTLEEVHPTPIYESLALLVIFAVLWRLRARFAQPWSLFGLYAVMSGTMRFLVEFVRRNPDELGTLTAAQLISLALVAVGATLFATARRRPTRLAPA